MKRFLLSFVTVFVLIPCIAQQTPQSKNARILTPCPFPDPIDPISQTICIGSSVVFTVSRYNRPGRWEMSTDSGVTWQPSIGTISNSAFAETLTIPVVSENMNGYLFRCAYDSLCEWETITNPAMLTVANLSLNIISHPADIAVCKFYPADFSVTASGSSLKYQWQISTHGGNSFTNMPGKTTSALHFDSAFLAMNNNQYRCIITSECNPTVITDAAVLTVKDEAVAIVTQPAYQFACMGDSARFTIGVVGNNLGYQWQQWLPPFTSDFENIAGENDSVFFAVASGRYVYYRCLVSSSCKTFNSYAVQINAIDPPTMTAAETKYMCSGEQTSLSFGSVGYQQDQLYNYQWQVSSDSGITFNNITPGGNQQLLQLTANPLNNNLIYRCHVSSSCYDGYSNFKSLKAGIPVSVTSQPQNKNGCTGFPISFSIKTIGSVSQYWWQESRDGGITFTDLFSFWDGITTPELKINFANSSLNNYQYRCRMSSNCFDTFYSDAAILHVFNNPSAPNDTSTEVQCDTCKANISGLFNTSGYAASSWENIDSSNAGAGKHKLNVFNASGCFDIAYAYVNVHEGDTLRICRNAVSRFNCNISGSTYQWQINTGGGFIDVTDDNTITGSATPDITILYTNTMKIRCRVDNSIYSDTIFVKATAYWTGTADSDWYNPLNWSCEEVPYYYGTEAVILNNTPHTPEIRRDALCKKLIMKPGASLIIQPGYTLYITGVN